MPVYPFDILKEADTESFAPAVLDQRPFVQRALRAEEAPARATGGSAETQSQREARHYRPGPQLRTAINTAIATGLPLLLTGEPGTGKTQAAWYIADRLRLGQVVEFPVRSTTTARDLIYIFESVRYMADSMRNRDSGRGHGRGRSLDRNAYVIKQALWKAFEAERPVVLLIDEIDKAPRDFPNDLLTELDQWVLRIDDVPDLTIRVPPRRRPIVVITSNGERALPDAFLRRCVYCDIELTEKMVNDALQARRDAGEITLAQPVLQAAQNQLFEWRRRDLQKKPALAELLAWIGVLEATGTTILPEVPRDMPGVEVVIKTREDRQSLGLRADS